MVVQSETDLNAVDTAGAVGAPNPPVSIPAVALRVLRLMRGHELKLSLAVVFAILAALLSLSPYLAVALALSEMMQPDVSQTALLTIGVLGAAGAGLEKICFGVATTLSHAVAFETQRKLRLDHARKLSRVPLGYLSQRSKGEFRTLMLDDVELLEDGMAHLIPEVGAALIAPLAALSIMAFLDWRLTILLILPMMIGMALMSVMMKRSEGPSRAYLTAQTKVAEVAAEIAEGLPTVRAFNQDEQSILRARTAFHEVTRVGQDWMKRAVIPGTSGAVLLSSHLLFVGPVGLYMAAEGHVSTQLLAAFLAVAYGFGDLFAAVHGISHRLMVQVQLLERLDALNEAQELPVPEKGLTPNGTDVEFDNVSFAYGTRQVLSGVSFRVPPGMCCALIGPSGSGKTTIARLVARFEDVAQGAVRIGGVDVRDMKPDTLYSHISYVFQDVFLFRGSVADNIRLGRPDASLDDVMDAAKAAGAHAFIANLPEGYNTCLGEGGYGLSGGERQRVSIARAILKDAPILILDEATAFADPENEALIQDAISRLAAGRTVIVIAHRLHTITGVDEILVVEKGQIVERGDFEALLRAGDLFARMWSAYETARSYRLRGGS